MDAGYSGRNHGKDRRRSSCSSARTIVPLLKTAFVKTERWFDKLEVPPATNASQHQISQTAQYMIMSILEFAILRGCFTRTRINASLMKNTGDAKGIPLCSHS